jgi:hypothetical protein
MVYPSEHLVSLLEQNGFGEVIKLGKYSIDPNLITALVERWRPETHTFHFPTGESTVTLEDVSMLIGLPVDGKAITGVSEWYYDNLCPQLLGKNPGEVGGNRKMILNSWLRDNFNDLTANSSARQKQQYCRAYILLLIGSVLMPDTSGSGVHLKYLVALKDFSKIGEYSWGSACLAVLYNQLCQA